VKEFQKAHSLDVDGIVGPRTRAEITRVQTVSAEKKDSQVAPVQPAASAPPQNPALAQLVSMGFPDVELNTQLLQKYNNDIDQVVGELLGA